MDWIVDSGGKVVFHRSVGTGSSFVEPVLATLERAKHGWKPARGEPARRAPQRAGS
ncbi:MAG: hypothetical protein AAB225_16750 [Acidobacteriota bacterium]